MTKTAKTITIDGDVYKLKYEELTQEVSDLKSITKNAAISANGDENTTVGNNIRWLEKNFIVPENYDRLTDKTSVSNSTFNKSGDIISGSYLAFEQYIKVEPNKTYYCNNILYFGAVRGYDASKAFVSNGVSVSGKQLTTGEGVYFVRISVNSGATPANVTFQLGTSATDAPLVFNGELNGLSVADFNDLKDTSVAEVLSTDWTTGALYDNGSTSTSNSRIYTTNHIKMLSGMRIVIRSTYRNGINVKVLTEKLAVDGESYNKIEVLYSHLIENGVQATINIPYDCYVRIQMYYRYDPTITDDSKAALINMIHIMNSSILNHISDRISATEENIGHKPPDDFILENRDLQNNNTLLFAWTSDTHHQIHGASEFGMTKEKLAEFSQVANAVRCDYLTITGDIVNGYYPVEEQKTNLVRLVKTIRDNCELPVLLVEGNHDDNSWYASANGSTGTEYTGLDEVLQNDQFTNYSMNNSIENVVFNPNDPLGGYYYKDFRKSKIRVIALNTADIPYIENEDKSLVYNGQSTFAFRQNQLNWIANTALKFTESGWGVILMMHYDSNMTDNTKTTHNADNLNNIMDAFQSRTSGTTTSTDGDFALSVSYDFTQNASDDVIAWFSGHRHDDKDEIIDGVPHVRIINPWNTTGGGFDIVTVDRVAKKIYTKRYNGEPMTTYDREIDYGS